MESEVTFLCRLLSQVISNFQIWSLGLPGVDSHWFFEWNHSTWKICLLFFAGVWLHTATCSENLRLAKSPRWSVQWWTCSLTRRCRPLWTPWRCKASNIAWSWRPLGLKGCKGEVMKLWYLWSSVFCCCLARTCIEFWQQNRIWCSKSREWTNKHGGVLTVNCCITYELKFIFVFHNYVTNGRSASQLVLWFNAVTLVSKYHYS